MSYGANYCKVCSFEILQDDLHVACRHEVARQAWEAQRSERLDALLEIFAEDIDLKLKRGH